MANKTKQFKKIQHNSCQSINGNVSTHFCIDLYSHDQFNSILKSFDAGPPKGMHRKESLDGATQKINVSCQLRFWPFVSCQLNFRLFVGCQLNDYKY